MNVLDVLDKDLVKVPLLSSDKKGIIVELVDTLVKAKGYSAAQGEQILDAVLARESLGSTGIGGGIAIPHAKIDVIEEVTMVLGISRESIDFDSRTANERIFSSSSTRPEQAGLGPRRALASIARSCTSKIFRRLLEQAVTARRSSTSFME